MDKLNDTVSDVLLSFLDALYLDERTAEVLNAFKLRDTTRLEIIVVRIESDG